jgi:prophage regulatory protein
MKFLAYDELKPAKGIPGSKTTIWRKERAGKFPRRVPFGERAYGWPENVIEAYCEALAAGCDEAEACKIAERERASA